MTKQFVLFMALLMAMAVSSQAANWPNWRGPDFNGSSRETHLPAKWSQTESVAWRAELPGPSAATPVIWENRVFLSGIDAGRDMLIAACYDHLSGQRLWQHDIAQGTSHDNLSNYGSPSPVTDGKAVVFFYSSGHLVCFDLAGNRKWARNIQDDYGPFTYQWTYGSSPLMYDGILYLQVLQRDEPVHGRGFTDRKNDSYLLAMEPATGKTLWRQIRPCQAKMESHEAYTTPIPCLIDGTWQLIVAGGDDLTGHDPKTGAELWRWGTYNPKRTLWGRLVPSAVFADGIVLVCAPKSDPVWAIRPGGKTGLLDDSALAWVGRDIDREVSSDVPTPAFYDGDFFVLNDLKKFLSRVEPATGKIKWSIKTPGKAKYEASPLAADGKIYLIDHKGEAAVIDAATGAILHQVGMDDLAGKEVVRASIIAVNGQLFIRTTRHLYCIGTKP